MADQRPGTLDAVRAVEDEEARLVAYTAYLSRLDERRAAVVAERRALMVALRSRPNPPTYRRMAELSGLAADYIRREVHP